MRQTAQEKKEELKQFALVGLLAVLFVGFAGGWLFYFKPRQEPAKAENAQHPYFMKYMAGQTKLRTDFNREMTQLGWPHILDFRRATGDMGMKASLELARKAQDLVTQYGNASKALEEDTLTDLSQMAGSEEEKKSAREMFEKVVAEPRRVVSRTWEMEGLVVAEVERIIKLMSPEPRRWMVVKDSVAFDLPGEQKEFDECLARVAAIAAEQNALRASMIEGVTRDPGK